MNLTSITLVNFKGTTTPVTIPLKPTPLLFGANSAGKSTILKTPIYSKELLKQNNPDPNKTILVEKSIIIKNNFISRDKQDLTGQIKSPLQVLPVPAKFFYSV
ncbi:MAG: hypothetical protein HQK65_02035 [Desulfamplus sp.]|nr:hypothetical protein [Desulfamplus sp.]